MNVGDLVDFPCDGEKYARCIGLLLGYHDNPADLKYRYGPNDTIRQVATVFYKGQTYVCWASGLRDPKNSRRS